jgi:uncharacterized protein (DUF305 family)
MGKGLWRVAILLMVSAGVARPAGHKDSRGVSDSTPSDSWPALMASMEKMHVAMASTESSGNSDSDFINVMLPHHRAAIEMAKTELLYGKDPQMRRLAQEIVTDQQSEIELMQLWLKQHGPSSAQVKPRSDR